MPTTKTATKSTPKSSKVIVYSTPTCPYCHAAKDFLKENKVAYEDVDVSKDQDRAQEMIEKSGQMGVPVIQIGNNLVIGFNKPVIEKLLKGEAV